MKKVDDLTAGGPGEVAKGISAAVVLGRPAKGRLTNTPFLGEVTDMYANTITITARTNDANRRIATTKVNGHVALASRLKRKWHSLRAWFVGEHKPVGFRCFADMQATFDQLRLAMSGLACAVVSEPRPVQVPGSVGLRRTRLYSLAAN